MIGNAAEALDTWADIGAGICLIILLGCLVHGVLAAIRWLSR